MLAAGAVNATGSAASAIASQVIIRILNGSFNPNYSKEDRRKMRYIQRKYSLAYQGGLGGDDPSAVIANIDAGNRLLMSPDGLKPANPFSDEAQFEESLQMNFHPVSGHQGRFVASHAMACIGVINDYQLDRKSRVWVPGVSSPGRPNDYVNLFLEETKQWMRDQMTLDTVHAEELARREAYYTKLKNDNYYWCFSAEKESKSIHKVIDFVHDKVRNALEIISREEKNRSLQSFFKELNDHTTNAFEFGKQYLAYLIYPKTKIGGNLVAHRIFDGRTYETGKLHNMLVAATDIVLEAYVQDMNLTSQHLDNTNALSNDTSDTAWGGSGSSGSGANYVTSSSALVIQQTSSSSSSSSSNPTAGAGAEAARSSYQHHEHQQRAASSAAVGQYVVDITEYEESTLKSVQYIIEMCDPKGIRWLVRKTYSEFETMHQNIILQDPNLEGDAKSHIEASFPTKMPTKLFRDKEEYYLMGKQLQAYLLSLLFTLGVLTEPTQRGVANFLEVKALHLEGQGRDAIRRAEGVPNVFVSLKRDFEKWLLQGGAGSTGSAAAVPGAEAKPTNTAANSSKKESDKAHQAMADFRAIWGIEMAVKIFDAYALLQRMATVLGWTLEINHFFISMFGNTLTFSKLPLRDIIFMQKDIMSRLLVHCNDLFAYACRINADAKYKWHKNLQMAENQLTRLRFHIERACALVSLIDTEHLDYETQMRRLQDVHARFQPLMNRIDSNLISIHQELSLPIPGHLISGTNATNNFAPSGPRRGSDGSDGAADLRLPRIAYAPADDGMGVDAKHNVTQLVTLNPLSTSAGGGGRAGDGGDVGPSYTVEEPLEEKEIAAAAAAGPGGGGEGDSESKVCVIS